LPGSYVGFNPVKPAAVATSASKSDRFSNLNTPQKDKKQAPDFNNTQKVGLLISRA